MLALRPWGRWSWKVPLVVVVMLSLRTCLFPRRASLSCPHPHLMTVAAYLPSHHPALLPPMAHHSSHSISTAASHQSWMWLSTTSFLWGCRLRCSCYGSFHERWRGRHIVDNLYRTEFMSSLTSCSYSQQRVSSPSIHQSTIKVSTNSLEEIFLHTFHQAFGKAFSMSPPPHNFSNRAPKLNQECSHLQSKHI